MELTVSFVATTDYATAIRRQPVGLDLVDSARTELGSRVSVGKFKNYIAGYESNTTLVLNEEVARASGLFGSTDRATVRVEKGSLNKFHKIVLVTEKDDSTGEITQVSFGWELDRERLETYWEVMNYPLVIE